MSLPTLIQATATARDPILPRESIRSSQSSNSSQQPIAMFTVRVTAASNLVSAAALTTFPACSTALIDLPARADRRRKGIKYAALFPVELGRAPPLDCRVIESSSASSRGSSVGELIPTEMFKAKLHGERGNNGGRGSREAQGEYPLVPRTLGEMGIKLLTNAQTAAVGPSGQRLGQSLPASGEDCRDVAGGQARGLTSGWLEGQASFVYYDDAESQGDSQTVASGSEGFHRAELIPAWSFAML
ncbi:hypothetical protein Acr_17g0008130 [Actinidia rufa]|uniref:Uncharacterized protein n=1 Tax=Actinidia rufa TaxID=165716 RepID=A0A7J0G389_9ERIC|nr:hypothetical protein Acr_17g0008130 [Actinidia rufa]